MVNYENVACQGRLVSVDDSMMITGVKMSGFNKSSMNPNVTATSGLNKTSMQSGLTGKKEKKQKTSRADSSEYSDYKRAQVNGSNGNAYPQFIKSDFDQQRTQSSIFKAQMNQGS